MQTKYEIKIVNCETGEEIIRPMTDEEIDIRKQDEAKAATKAAEVKTKAEAKATLLDRLGITADEAKLLLS